MRKSVKKVQPIMIRQGDVLITNQPIETSPITIDKDRIVLAYGETTGHAHVIAESDVQVIEVDDQQMLISENGIRIVHGNQVSIPQLKSGQVKDPAKIDGLLAPGQDHNAIQIPAGRYGSRIQSQYSPEEIRSVQD